MVTPFPNGRLSGMLGMPSSPWTPEPENITKLGDKMGVGPAGHNKDAKQHDDDDMDARDAGEKLTEDKKYKNIRRTRSRTDEPISTSANPHHPPSLSLSVWPQE